MRFSRYLKEDSSSNFKQWFGNSVVVNKDGSPLKMYHGSGTTIKEFDPAFTGKGNDQLGSGFYFTTDPDEAQIYTKQKTSNQPDAEKIGGEDNPNVIEVYLSIQNPIKVVADNLNDTNVKLTQKQAYNIIKFSPTIMDKENSPLGDWFEEYWNIGPKDWMVKKVAQHYVGSSLISLENDFFRGAAGEFRTALNKVLGYDGVVQDFGNNQFASGVKHYVTWFPSQIKSANNNNGNYNPGIADITECDPLQEQIRTVKEFEKELENLFVSGNVDVTKHFVDRTRERKISPDQIVKVFKFFVQKYSSKLTTDKKRNVAGVIQDVITDLNIPVNWDNKGTATPKDDVISLITVMQKKGFVPNNRNDRIFKVSSDI